MSRGHQHAQRPPAAPGPERAAHRRALRTALLLIASFTAVEIVGAVLTGSLALLADAVHMLSDNLSLALALLALGLATRPATAQRSFGYRRAEILAALVNGLALVAVAIWILYEATRRLASPPDVIGAGMLAVAVAGLLVNLAALRVLMPFSGDSLNTAGAMRHVVADALGSVGVIAAALVILTTGYQRADAIIGALIAILVAASAVPIIRDSVRILLEQAPPGIDAEEVGRAMAAVPGVLGVHDLHIWTITSGFPALAAHVTVAEEENGHLRRLELERLLRERYGLEHTTLQLEPNVPEEPLQVGRPKGEGAGEKRDD